MRFPHVTEVVGPGAEKSVEVVDRERKLTGVHAGRKLQRRLVAPVMVTESSGERLPEIAVGAVVRKAPPRLAGHTVSIERYRRCTRTSNSDNPASTPSERVLCKPVARTVIDE